MHEVVEAVLAVLVHFGDEFVDFSDTVVDDLDAVVEVGELVLLAADVACEHVFEYLWDIVVTTGFVGLLFVDLLRGQIGLLLVIVGRCIALAVGLLASYAVGG